jgi:hypothetical protein
MNLGVEKVTVVGRLRYSGSVLSREEFSAMLCWISIFGAVAADIAPTIIRVSNYIVVFALSVKLV